MNWFSGWLYYRSVIVLALPPSKHQGIEIGTGSQVGYSPAGSLFYPGGSAKTMTLR
jgi:hypothetical protein